MRVTLAIFLSFFFHVELGYTQTKKAPANLKQALVMLQSDLPDSLRAVIIKTDENKLINLCYPWSSNSSYSYKTIYNWLHDAEGAKINKYLINKGVSTNQYQQTVILIAFKRLLLKQPIDERLIFKPYQLIEY